MVKEGRNVNNKAVLRGLCAFVVNGYLNPITAAK